MYLSQHVRSYDANTYLPVLYTTYRTLLFDLSKPVTMSTEMVDEIWPYVGLVYNCWRCVHPALHSAHYRRRLHATLSSIDMLSD